jgi:nucleotide-binding universal stress UspA family protein
VPEKALIRRVLVAMDGSPHGEAAAGLAFDWVGRFGVELIGLGILDEPSITSPGPASFGGTAFKRHRDDVRLAAEHRRVLDLLPEFRQRCDAARVPCSVVEDTGASHEQIVAEAAGCDVVLLGRETHFQFESQDHPDTTLSKVLRESPRPVVVVPRDRDPGEGVLVAYGSGREVARALQTLVLLGLAGDEPVCLLAVDHDVARAETRLGPAARFLAAHSARAVLRPLASEAAPAGLILEEVRCRRPRLLVMGAHGHHPVRDLFFTSVTRAVLREASVPVFVGA